MNRLLSLGIIALTMSCAYGGVVREDSMLDMLQGLVSDPDAYASALGMARVKRGAWDKEFNLEKMGFNFKIKYHDPSNKLKGGVAEVSFQDVRKFVRRVPVKSVKFVVNFDGGDNNKDGIFNLNIDYEFGFLFGGQDSGKLHFERTTDGTFYNTNVEFMSNSENNADRPPTVKLDMKSDYKSMAEMRLFFDNFKDAPKEYKADLEFVNKDTFKGKFEGEKVYNFEGKYDAAEKRFNVEVDFAGKKYNGFADVDFDGNQAVFKVNFDLGAAGKLDLEFNGQKDFSAAGVKVFFNDRDIFTAKLKGKMDQAPRVFMYELRYSGMFVGDGKLRMSYERFKELKFQYLPKTGMTFEYMCEMMDDRSLQFHSTAQYNDEKEFDVTTKFVPVNDANTVGYNMKMNWFVRDMSPFYRFFYSMNCLHCLTPFQLESNLAMQKNKLYKFDFDVTSVEEDGSSHKEVYITTNDKYYAMFSEHFLNEMSHMFNYYQRFNKDFEIEGEWNPGKYLKVTANRPWFQSFMIENMDGYMRKVEFNGKELMKAGWDKNGKQIKQTVELPNGEKMDTQVTWDTDSFWANKAKLTFDGPRDNKVETEFDWDFTDSTKKLNWMAEGDNEMFGKFKLTRNYEYQHSGPKYSLRRMAMTDIPNSPLPANFETEVEAEMDGGNSKFGMYFLLGGDRYGFQMNNGKVNWTF